MLVLKESRQGLRVRYVLLGSRAGLYGGPFDTSISQQTVTDFDVIVCGYFKGDKPQLRIVNLSMHPVRHVFGLRSFFDVSSLAQLIHLWKKAKCDVVHISFARAIGPMAFLFFCRLRKVEGIILQTHGMLTSRSSRVISLFDILLTKNLIPSGAKFVALTETEQSELLAWNPNLEGRVFVIGNPTVLPPEADMNVEILDAVVFIARLHPRKNVMSFGRAAQFAFESNWPEKYFVLGPDEGDLEELLRLTQSLANFSYLGSTDSKGVLDRLRQSKIFALTSTNEPWGNVLVSAIAMGKPVVVTSSSALAPIVAKYGCGLVVDDGNHEEIANAVHFLLEDTNYATFSRNAIVCADSEFGAAAQREAWRLLLGSLE